jgi:GTP cyclohydrolase I
MQDTQSLADDRGIDLEQVGLCGLRYPIVVLDRSHAKQHTTAEIDVSVNLPRHFKGTHMSRFIEVMNENRGELTMHTLPHILHRLREHLEAESARLEARFDYFLERSAPESGATGMMDYACSFLAETRDGTDQFWLTVEVPVTSLCPCSKAISDYGAHNQRGRISMKVQPSTGPDGSPDLIWIEELVELAEKCGSAPVYPLLKRADERHVTMQAYDNPVFVEDMVRNAATRLREDIRVSAYEVRAVNDESIHNHSVFASANWERS